MAHWHARVPPTLPINAGYEQYESAEVAELADATDLKSVRPHGLCGFDPRPRQVSMGVARCEQPP